jgi:hypothetical protein
MIYSSLKAKPMQLSEYIKEAIVLSLLCLLSTVAIGQARISQVELSAKADGSYVISYFLRLAPGETARIGVKVAKRVYSGQYYVPMQKVTGDIGEQYSGGSKKINWTPKAGELKKGELIKAELLADLHLKKPNIPPTVTIRGDKIRNLRYDEHSLSLQASASDADGLVKRVKWSKVSGVGGSILTPTTFQTVVSGLSAGRYVFQVEVEDDRNASTTDTIEVIVQEPPVTIAPTRSDVTTTQSFSALSQGLPPANPPMSTVPVARPVLKGGPSNAALSLILPGLGHYFVSGDHNGVGRKKSTLLISAFYLGVAGGTFYLKSEADKKQKALQEYAGSQYQRDASGSITGVRGADQKVADRLYMDAVDAQNNFTNAAYAGIGILTADFIWTLVKGMHNQRNFKRENRRNVSFAIYPEGNSHTVAAIKVRF